jgi:hypothetical protein
LDMQSKIFTDFQNETLCVASSIVSYLTFWDSINFTDFSTAGT